MLMLPQFVRLPSQGFKTKGTLTLIWRNHMKILTILIGAIVFSTIFVGACNFSVGTGSNTSNSNNANSTNTSNSSSETNKTVVESRDMTPLTMSISEFIASNDKDNEGRTVTVTGGQLDEISYDSLLIRDGAGYAFHCYGSFSEYMSTKTKIDSLRQQHRSPGATVRGIYKMSSYNSADLSPCVLVDLVK